MVKKRSSQKVIFIFWKYQDSELHFGTYDADGYKGYIKDAKVLDRTLLPLVGKYMKSSNLAGVAVVPNQISGFSSSRLIFITLNLLAWLKNVPIHVLPSSAYDNSGVRDSLCSQMLSKGGKFSKQVLPQYQYPVDITPSKKKKGFTITK